MSPSAWLVVAVLILLNAFYVAAEFSAVGARRSRVRRLSEDGHRLARILLKHIEQPATMSRYVAASQLGITVVSLILGAYAEATLAVSLAPSLASTLSLEPARASATAQIVVLIILAGAQAVLGELMPKSLALQFPTEVALVTVLPMRWTLRIFKPFIALVNGASTAILRLFGAGTSTQRHVHSPEEIELLIAESRDGGLLEADEQQRLHRALRLGMRPARDLMVPLDRVTTVSIDLGWDDLVRSIASTPFSRIPVFRDSRDRIVGTLRVKDLVHRYVTQGPAPVQQFVRPIVRIPQDLPADRIVSVLREKRAHQAIVVDPSDRPVGLLTIQDVIVALLGAGTQRA